MPHTTPAFRLPRLIGTQFESWRIRDAGIDNRVHPLLGGANVRHILLSEIGVHPLLRRGDYETRTGIGNRGASPPPEGRL